MDVVSLLPTYWHAIAWALTFALFSIGLTLLFRILKFFNIAHGTFVMLTIFLTYWLINVQSLSFFQALVVAPILITIFGLIVERTIFRPVEGDIDNSVLLTTGFMIFFQQVILAIFGGTAINLQAPITQRLTMFGESFPLYDLFMALVSTAAIGGFWMFLMYTNTGLRIRALADDREEAQTIGININRYLALVFGICIYITSLGAVLIIPYLGGHYLIGLDVLVVTIVIAWTGGAGSVRGAIAASLLFSVTEYTLLQGFTPTFARILSLTLLIGIVLVRPQGLIPAKI
jgi:branched-subunit amino acid ABC-type transport system permease component